MLSPGDECIPIADMQTSIGSDRFDSHAFHRLHELWNNHAAQMDRNGRHFLQELEDLHREALVVLQNVH